MPEYEDPFLRPGFDYGDDPEFEVTPGDPIDDGSTPDVPDDGLGTSGTISGSEDDLTGTTEDYSQLTCTRCSTNWIDAPNQDCFQAVSITATRTTRNVVLLTSNDGSDGFYIAMKENSYANVTIGMKISGASFVGDYIENIPVRLDGGDSINIQVQSTGIQFFELIKDGQQWVSSETIAALNSSFSNFEITITLTEAYYCVVPEPPAELPEVEVTEEQQEAIAGTGITTPITTEPSTPSWSKEDSWVLIGGLVLIGIGYYLFKSMPGDLDG